MKKIIVILSAFALVACKSTTTNSISQQSNTTNTTNSTKALTEADVERGKALFPNLTLASLQEGKLTYEANCGKCHALISPSMEPHSIWKREVPPMVKKVNKSSVIITEAQQQTMLEYLLTMSKK